MCWSVTVSEWNLVIVLKPSLGRTSLRVTRKSEVVEVSTKIDCLLFAFFPEESWLSPRLTKGTGQMHSPFE